MFQSTLCSIVEASGFFMIMLIIVICNLDYVHQEQCLCTGVEKNGDYCGTELNELSKQNSCPKNMYFCGDTNRNNNAVLLAECEPGQECDQKSFFSNACYKKYQCECPKGLQRGQVYCGDLLTGEDCMPNVTYTCPYLSMFFDPSPMDACLFGCRNGTCLQPPS